MGHATAQCATAARADGYARRAPEHTVLQRTLSAHWPAFVEQAEEAVGCRASTSFDELRRASRHPKG
ncbi:MAG TPA: hypothetical protein VF331_04030 [Polyangiales bacterium]